MKPITKRPATSVGVPRQPGEPPGASPVRLVTTITGLLVQDRATTTAVTRNTLRHDSPAKGTKDVTHENVMTQSGRGMGARSLTRRRLAPAALAVVVLVSSGVGATEASAHTPRPGGSSAPSTDGCSNVPDRPHGFSFKSICDKHDICYADKPYGRSAAGRRRCDSVFRTNLTRWCRNNLTNRPGVHRDISGQVPQFLPAPERQCLAVAKAYWYGVRRFGCHAFWNDGQPFYASCKGH